MLSLEECCHSNAERKLYGFARGARRSDDNDPPARVAGFSVRLPIRRQEVIAGRVHAGRKGKFQTEGKG
jgi:hypothetical protein